MKAVSTTLQTHFGQSVTTLAVLWKVTLANGTVLGFTTFDKNIVYNGVTYLASSGILPTANETQSDMAVDNLEVAGFLDNVIIKESDIRNGVYDYAKVEQRVVNWNDLTMGDVIIRKGIIGNITMKNGLFNAEVRGLTQYLSTNIGALYGPLCRSELYSTPTGTVDPATHYPCWVKEADYIQSGTVASSSDALHVTPNYSGSTPAFVQGAKADFSSQSSSVSKAFGSNNTAGNLLIVYVVGAGIVAANATVSDTQGNVYSQLFVDSSVTGAVAVAWYALNCKIGANTVTVSWVSGTYTVAISIAEYSGIVTVSALDQTGKNTGSGAWSTPAVTTAQPNELLIAFVQSSSALGSTNSPFTNREVMNSAGTPLAEFADNIVLSTGIFQATGSNTGNFLAFIATFRGVATTSLLQKGSLTPTASAPSGWFTDGEITFTSGLNNGFSFEIKSWDGVTVTLFLPLPYPTSSGDTFTIEPGCDKTPTTSGCLKFQGYSSDGFQTIVAATNILNFRGEPFIPGQDQILNYPDAR